MVVKVLSPNRSRGKKRKLKQSKIQIHGEKKKLVIKLPEEESESSSGHKKTAPRATSSPVVIDLGTESDKSSKSAHSSKVAVKQETVQSEKLIHHLIQKKVRNKKRQKKKKKRKRLKVLLIKENRMDLLQQNQQMINLRKKHWMHSLKEKISRNGTISLICCLQRTLKLLTL